MARPRARDIGIIIGVLPPGSLNSITDIPGVKVGHVSLIEGKGKLVPGKGPIRTGVTAIVPHGGNMFTEKVCAAVYILNATGKVVGFPQVAELGNIETPIMLTNTLNVWTVADALVDYISEQNPGVYSFNPVVGECNDRVLNDILGRHVKREHVFQALQNASETNTEEGNIGAGVGTRGFEWKAGIGTASRLLPKDLGDFTLGALVLTNTGRASDLRIDGIPIGKELTPNSYITQFPHEQDRSWNLGGSIMIILGTDAPLSNRQLTRLSRWTAYGLGHMGLPSAGGDFVIAFSTGNLISPSGKQSATPNEFVPESQLSSLFRATVETTEEAIINSLLKAETMVGRDETKLIGIPIEQVTTIIGKYRTNSGN